MKTQKFLEKYTQKPTSVFKRLFVLFFFGFLPFMILHIILNIAGIIPVNFNDEQIYGLTGILVIIGFAPLIVLIFTVLTYFGLMCGYWVLKGIKALSGNREKPVANNI